MDGRSEKECLVKVFTPERRLLASGTLKIKQGKGTFTPDEKSLPTNRQLDLSPQFAVFAETVSGSEQFELHNWQLGRYFLGDELRFDCLVLCDA